MYQISTVHAPGSRGCVHPSLHSYAPGVFLPNMCAQRVKPIVASPSGMSGKFASGSVYLLQRFPHVPHADAFLCVGGGEHSGVHRVKHDGVKSGLVLRQAERFRGAGAAYIINQDSPVVAGAGKDIVIVWMNGQTVDRLFVQEEVEDVAPATIKMTSEDATQHAARIRESLLRFQVVDYDLIVVPRGKYLGLAAVVTETEYIANVLGLHHGGLAHTPYCLLHIPQ